MRTLIAISTFAGVLTLANAQAGIPKKEDTPKNINLLKSASNAKVRAQAAEDLGRRGGLRASDVADAIDPLITALGKDKDADVRRASATALGEIGSDAEKVVDALSAALKDSSTNVKIAAIIALGQFGPDAKSALPALRDLAKMKDDKKVSQTANTALKQIAGMGKKKN